MSTLSPSKRPRTHPPNQSQASQSPMSTPTRRVLGELTPNARLHAPSAPGESGKLSPTPQALKPSSPLKQVHTLSPSTRDRSASVLGRKRSIYEVEGLENAPEARRPLAGGVADAWKGDEIKTEPRREEDAPRDVTTPTETTVVPFGDDLSTTEADTPEPEEQRTPQAGIASHESSASKVSQSFSSLIDYNPSGGQSQDVEREDTFPPQGPSPLTIKEKAEALRLRLRVAMYKVQTDQTNVPMASLQLPSPPSASKTPRARRDPETSSPASSTPVARTRLTPSVASVSPTKASASSTKTFPSLLPAPLLRPTSYSKRDISYACPPSSPPLPVPTAEEDAFATPIARRMSPRGDGSDSPLASSERRIGRIRRDDEDNLTSSVVKGRAANGLLELRRG